MQNLSTHHRRAVILHDNRKGLIEAVIFFEDGGTKIHQSFSGKPETMMEDLNTVKKELVANYQIRLDNIMTRKTPLAVKRSERRDQISKTFALLPRQPGRKAAKKVDTQVKVKNRADEMPL